VIRVDAASLQRVVGNIADFRTRRGRKLLQAAADAAGQVAYAEVAANIRLTDYSLSDLRNMDHPYARRHGRVRIHSSRPYVVHTRTGRLAASLRGQSTTSGRWPGFRVGFDTSIAPHAEAVVRGTFRMLPRDVIAGTLGDKRVRKMMMEAAADAARAEL